MEQQILTAIMSGENVPLVVYLLAYMVGRNVHLIKSLTGRVEHIEKKTGVNHGG